MDAHSAPGEPRHVSENLIGRLGPHEGRGPFVMRVDELLNRGLQLRDVPMHAAAELSRGQGCKPPLDPIEPGGIRRGEVHVVAWPLRQPPPDQAGLMGCVVIQHEMDLEVGGHGGVLTKN